MFMVIKREYKREIDENEFLKMKKLDIFNDFRQLSKQINFSMIFGASFKRFSQGVLEISWSEERVKQFCKDKNLQESVTYMSGKYENVEEKYWYYYAASNFIRTQFFDSYKGLIERIERNTVLAKEHGYIRSFHGAIRRTPLLMWCQNDEGRTRKDEDFKEIAGLVNITANTTVQNNEICVINPAIVNWESDAGNNEYAPIIGTTHDSADMYVKKSMLSVVIPKLKTVFEKPDIAWQNGMEFTIESIFADLLEEGRYYKNGVDADDWNNKNIDNH